jgi:hypothetical protein
MGTSYMGRGPDSDSAGKAQELLYQYITDPSSRRRGSPILKNRTSANNFRGEKEKLVEGPRWWRDTRIDWPTDRQ